MSRLKIEKLTHKVFFQSTDFSLEHNHRLSSTSTTQNPNFPSSDVASVLWWSVRPSRRRHHPSPTPSVGVLSKPFLVCLLTRKGLFFSGRNLFAVGSEFVRFGFSETISIGLLCRLVDWCLRQIAAVTVVVFGGSVSFLLARSVEICRNQNFQFCIRGAREFGKADGSGFG
ncbi:hypothetical protein QL285_031227 [Trifolium repens]|nr:hypothetical protein QL285_031227 [Trifolium repens]